MEKNYDLPSVKRVWELALRRSVRIGRARAPSQLRKVKIQSGLSLSINK